MVKSTFIVGETTKSMVICYSILNDLNVLDDFSAHLFQTDFSRLSP